MQLKPTYLLTAATLTLLLGGCAVTPQPLTSDELRAQVAADLENMFAHQEAVSAPISLPEAIARALKYNLDHRLKMMENALADRRLQVTRLEQLPQLTVAAGYHARNNDSGGVSQSLLTGTQSLEASTSQEKRRSTADATLVWNTLDFGVSYVRARQQSNEVLIAEERRRKVVQNIVQDVRYAYWRAVSAQRLLDEMDALLDRTYAALEQSRQMESLRVQSPMQSLTYQKALLEVIQEMWSLRKELASAQTELAALMNLKPGTTFTVVAPAAAELPTPALSQSVEELEQRALQSRPEVVEEHYQARVGNLEVRKAVLQMFPGLEINAGPHYDSNKFLFNNTWTEAGLSVSWNLFNVFSGPANKRLAEAQVELDSARRLALNMAVLTQVHLAWQRYQIALRDYDVARDRLSVEERIQTQMEAEQKAAVENELEVIRTAAATLVSRMQHDLSYAELQNALGRVRNSVGVDPLPGASLEQDVKSLAGAIERQLQQQAM